MDYSWLDSPIGRLLIAGDERGLCRIEFPGMDIKPAASWLRSDRVFGAAIEQLREYFEGRRTKFDLQLAFAGTSFQRRVWEELRRIPYGKTISYGELARRVGNARASRAVGAANGSNPIPIVIPCHRVIGADGSLTGFGGGVSIKKFLLELEDATCRGVSRPDHRECIVSS